MIPGPGRSPGEGIGYPLQYSWASLVTQLVKNLPAIWETVFDPWVGKIPWRRERLPIPVLWPENSMDYIVPANVGHARDIGSVPGLGRYPGGGHGNPLQYSCLENPMDRGARRGLEYYNL